MKLNEIKTVAVGEYDLNEGVIPVHLTMTLEQIVRDGKVSNPVQTFIMAAMIEMFKNGGPTRWPRDLNAYEMATSADLIDAVKSLSDAESANMAMWLLSALQVPAGFERNPYTSYCNPQLNIVDWIRWVLRKQD